MDLAQLLALVVRVEHGELRLGVPQRHLLTAVLDADRQQLVLHLVLEVDELACEQAALARLPEAMQSLALYVVLLPVLTLAQVVELLSCEQVGVACDDRRRLGALLLADTDGSRLLGSLRAVGAERRLELLGCANRRAPHGAESTPFLDIIRRGGDVRGGHPGAVRHSAGRAVGDLTGALTRLERIAAEPDELDEDTLEVLPVLQYSLHRAGEAIQGIAPLPASAEAHRELAAALEDARDVTGDVACLLEVDDYEGATELVHEWRGALFRVRLARRRLIRLPPPLPAELEDLPTTTAAAVALVLLAAGTIAFLAGAVLVIWPLWAAGLGVVATSLLVYRP